MNAAAEWISGFEPARGPCPGPGRIVRIGPEGWEIGDGRDLSRWLAPGDLLVLNDAATLPASIRDGDVELRIAAWDGDFVCMAVLGAGDWRTPTEHRGVPRRFSPGDVVLGCLRVEEARERWFSARILDAGAFRRVLYGRGEPIRYSYLRSEADLQAFQTGYAAVPWGSEMPSAGRRLTAAILMDLRRRGVRLATLTHAAGLSSIDGGDLDGTLPWPEKCRIPAATIDAIASADRVIAVGTTVVRALEGVGRTELRPGDHTVDLVLGPDTELRVCDGLLTNLHAPGESHFELLSAFLPRESLLPALAAARDAGMVDHEFGDGALILR